MVRGFYSAAAGVFCQQKSFNVISNNISNASTAGFKCQSTSESSFGEHFVSRMRDNTEIGSGAFATVNNSCYTDISQGALEKTGKSVDMAIQGEGFFLVESNNHGEKLTRDGQFVIDNEGYLILPDNGRVLDKNKKSIRIRTSDFTVDAQGVIRENDREIATLYIAVQDEGIKHADAQSYQIIQGAIEKSNINIAKEISKMIAGQNHFQSCIQIIKMYDKINEISANQIGRIS
ncbi:MAG: flagellar hook basal-body protein [Eubacteriales bacterium]|nr:flagellar hook basal-body protein [Eubacteriales bacterium]